MNELSELALKYDCDKGEADIDGHQSHQYTRAYIDYFTLIKDEVKNVLEVGIGHGGSLKMWRDFFPNAQVYGVDYREKFLFQEDRIRTFKGGQGDPLAIRNDIAKLKTRFDIIIDDGSHMHNHQQGTMSALFKFLNPGGLYCIEDLHCAFYPEYGLDVEDHNTTLNFLQRYVDKGFLFSKFLSRQQIGALRRMVGECKIHGFPRAHNRGGKSIVGVLLRK